MGYWTLLPAGGSSGTSKRSAVARKRAQNYRVGVRTQHRTVNAAAPRFSR